MKNGPFIKSNNSTNDMMIHLLIALMPIVCFSIFKNTVIVYLYTDASFISSLYPVFIIITSILTSYLTELLWYKFINKLTLKKAFKECNSIYAIIPGLLLSLILPVTIPLWLVVFGSFCGTVIGKMLYGGFSKNIFNPALIGYLLISICYPTMLGSYSNILELDTIASSTPLTNFSSNLLGSYEVLITPFGNLLNFFVGTIPGTLGETSKILILVAFIYLVFTKTIKFRIPSTYILTVFILTTIIGLLNNCGIYYPLFNVLSGGLLFGAVFMATDPVTSPKTDIGQIIYGICLGLLTVYIRYLTNYPEGVMTSILFMNMFVYIIDNIGIKLRYNKKLLIIPIALVLLISTLLVFKINNKLNVKDSDDKVKIINKEVNNNKEIYEVTSKGFGIIKATVTVIDNNITSIDVTDYSSETQWNEIINHNYIDEVIKNQKNIDDLDTIAGSTYSSNSLKNIVKEVLK